MTKRAATDEFSDEISSDDDLHIDVYTDMLERLTIEQSDSSDNEIAPPKRQLRRCSESDGDRSSGDESMRQDGDDSTSNCDGWEDVTESTIPPPQIPFDLGHDRPGPQVPANIREPIEFFKLYFTDELVERIVKETNEYAEEVLKKTENVRKSIWQKWYDVTEEEFFAFIGVILNMGLIQLPNIEEYWSGVESSRIPFFTDTFSRTRFLQIFWMMHLKKPIEGSRSTSARIQKINDFLRYIDEKFRRYFIPYGAVTVDEAVVKFRGRISFVNCNPNRPNKWGVRVYALADSRTGYLFTILPYYGSETSENIVRPDLPTSTRIPLHLYMKLLERVPYARGYHMFTDKNYTSILLAEELRRLNCHLTGAIKISRRGVPHKIRHPRFSVNKTVAYRKGNLTLLAWKDKKVVTMLTNYYSTRLRSTPKILRSGDVVNVTKPEMLVEYAANLSGAEHADQYASTYCFMRKSLKWWRKLFFWGLEMCMINSYIVYRITKQANNERPLSHHNYVKTLVEQLRGDFRESKNRPTTSYTGIRLEDGLHVPDVGKDKRDCAVCVERNVPVGKRHTIYSCTMCTDQPPIHVGECFRVYHTTMRFID